MTDRPCEEWLDAVSAYVDGELSVEEELGVHAHLRACPHCTELLVDLIPVVQALRTLPTPRPGLETWAAIAAQLDAPGARPWPPLRTLEWRRPLAGLAAAAAALTLVGGLQWLQLHQAGPAAPVADLDTYWHAHDAFEQDRGLPGTLSPGSQAVEASYMLDP